jgi:xanthine dehydrogenase/oxidase
MKKLKFSQKLQKRTKKFKNFDEVAKHFEMVANVSVRNIGTIAGNLMIKNAHNEFPSEISGAEISVINNHHSSVTLTIKEFLTYNMTNRVLAKVIFSAYDPSKYTFCSFKVMPRAQNAHAYVNAAFLLELNDQKNAIVLSRICFGGIDPNFVHAEKTEIFLVGKQRV